MANIWKKFNKAINTEDLKKDVVEAAENSGEYEDVPRGTYEVAVEKMELKESKKGNPVVSIWFNVVSDKCKGQKIFFNQVITQGFQIHIVNELLRKLLEEDNAAWEIEFEDYEQYGNLLMDVMEAIENKFEYGLKYGENKKGYSTYEITEVFVLD